MIPLDTPIISLQMVGPIYGRRLKKLGIETVEDLLYHIPFRYEDLSKVSKINNLQLGEKATVIGKIISIKNIYTKRGKKIQKAILSDESEKIEIVWYNQPFLIQILKPGVNISVSGKTKWFGNRLCLESPSYEIIRSVQKLRLIHTARLVPVYPETAGVSSKWLRSRINSILTKFDPKIEEFIPRDILTQFDLMSLKKAVYNIHFPSSYQEASLAKKRLSFNELFILQLAARIRQSMRQKEKVRNKLSIAPYNQKIHQLIQKLPFTLTNAQQKSITEILNDLAKENAMNRLLEGDVGSGKTVVATIAVYLVFLNGFQSVLMAPTEILAIQHYETINDLLKPYGVNTTLITGSIKPKKTKMKSLFQMDSNIYIGTHALLSEKVAFGKVGLVIIDEQQRFGVKQRALLRKKGGNPHVLTMTATPIPRSIALTLYADLDLSVIDEMPKGRIPAKTWVVPKQKREAAYAWIRKQVKRSIPRKQAFIICPLIEHSETLDTAKAATVEFEKLEKDIFSDLYLGLLHGKMTTKKKNKVLEDFKNGVIDILVSTPVVEVGIDIPTATIMMVEGAERFGLSQIHQLRGRVGRGKEQSYCLLFTDSENTKSIKRLKLLETTFSGPRLAELDLNLRGAGELFGTRQHGQMGLKIADISDLPIIRDAKKATQMILSQSYSLAAFPLLKEKVQKYTIENIAPD